MVSTTRGGERDAASRLSEGLEPMHLGDQGASNNQTPSPEQPGISFLGIHVKEVISTINRLEGLGLQRMDIPLPKCIVLGEQSTGKSSVIEAISGIKTPRSEDTCTRCPLFIKLEPAQDPRANWSASVSLRRDYGYDRKPGRKSNRRFPGWSRLEQTSIIPFATTEDANDLERIITHAQLATVSPLVDVEEFRRPSIVGLGDHPQCKFSPNVVCISITQPHLPALSFYDLPGLIGQAETEEEQYSVQFVRDLVTDYVKDSESLILVCCSLATDIANSTAAGIARKLKATDRCIGVLTKPDLLPKGMRHDKLIEVFDRKRFDLGHGYFVVRNLDQKELNKGFTHQQARVQEQQFFSEDVTWATTFKDYQHRFGTQNLQGFLSRKLAEQIIKKLPIIEEQIDIRLHQVETNLEQFPEPPTHNATRIISDVILDFSQELRKEIEADFPHKKWRNEWRTLQKDFFEALTKMKPTMITKGEEDESVYDDILATLPGSSVKKPIPITDGDGDTEFDEEEDPGSPAVETPTKKRKTFHTSVPSPAKTPSRRALSKPPEDTEPVFPDFSDLRKQFSLDGVRQYLSENSQSRIPGQIEPRVINNMMLESISFWDKPLDHFFTLLASQVKSQVHTIFKKHFKNREGSTFYANAWKIVEEMLDLNFHQQRTTMANESLNDEKEGPYIFHDDIFDQEKNIVLSNYRDHRLHARLNMYTHKKLKRTKKDVTPAEEEKLKKDERSMAVLRYEPYELELGVIAQVYTYYMLAARRFHDSVCMRIESKFYRQLCMQMRDELENGLGLNDGDGGHRNAVRLLAESPQRYNQRRKLVGQRDSLIQGQRILKELQVKQYGGGSGGHGSSDGVSSPSSQTAGVRTPLSGEIEEMEMEIE